MGIELILPGPPEPTGVEVVTGSVFGARVPVVLRVFDTNAAGNMDDIGDYAVELETGSDEWAQLKNALAYCGITEDAKTWLAKTPKEEALKALKKWICEVLIPKFVAAVNKFRTGQASSPTVPYATFEELVEDAVVRKIVYGRNPDGTVTASLPAA